MSPRAPGTKRGDLLDLSADRARALALTPVSRETAQRLDRFIGRLVHWQKTTNLVAPSTLLHIWTRHVADSLQLVDLVPDALVWVDLGSGAGFPGLVIACALTGKPGAMVHLVESNGKKVAFLREAARAAEVPALIHHQRIEDFVADFAGPVDVVAARALAPLSRLLDLAFPLLKTGAQGLFLKGLDVEAELTEASKYWKLPGLSLIPSKTDTHGRVIVIHGIERRAISS